MSVKISLENIWKILSKHLEKFKHSNGPQNLLVKILYCVALRFTIPFFFFFFCKTAARVLRKLFDIRFSYKHCILTRLPIVNMASKTVIMTRSIDRFSLSGSVKVEKTVAGSTLLLRHHEIREKRTSPLFCLD